MRPRTAAGPIVLALLACACSDAPKRAPEAAANPAAEPTAAAVATREVPSVAAFRVTDALPDDPDDPAIWVNRTAPAESLVIATMKVPAPAGGIAVFGLDGHQRQFIPGADRPNNVDVEYGLDLDGTPTDIAVVTERLGRRLRVYAIDRGGKGLRDRSAGTLPILTGADGDQGAPMGVGLYRRPRDGAIFAIVAPKSGPVTGYLWQYRLADDGTGRVGATLVRRFGAFSGVGEIEAVAVDDELGVVYYADETSGIHKWRVDPDAADAGRELALFGTSGYQQDREGLGIYDSGGGTGYIVSVDQLPGQSVFHLYRREGAPGRPDDHSEVVGSFVGGADGTDGLDVTSAPLGPDFPEGLVVAMNSTSRNFLLFRWNDIAERLRLTR